MQRELLTVVWALTLLRPYLGGTRFKIPTDHEVLWWILTNAEATGKLARWILKLSEFTVDTVYRTGVKHQAGDALWYLKTKEEYKSTLDDELPVLTIP